MKLKKIDFLESAAYSAWPKRLLGLDSWQKKERDNNQIIDEYENYWYKKALALWGKYTESSKNLSLGRFFRFLDEEIKNQIIQNSEIYGVLKDEHLISINQELYITNWSTLNSLYENLLIDTIASYINQYPSYSLVELGCGTGKNLFGLYQKLPINQIIGGDICGNALKLANAVANHFNIPGCFKFFDYYQQDSLFKLVDDMNDKYILFTSHSIEQIQLGKTNLVEQIRELKYKPEIIIHFEPILNPEDSSLFHQLQHKYNNHNLYNSDLLDTMLRHQNNGDIRIIDYKKDVLGTSAFNSTSILVWQCV
ncbi:class I SAM-dependent methyltransferase [Legionella pneumophila subsp. fraseri]|nr:class I SAM-dependent methyltransferase [Legionella pneumophila]MDW8879101.1 class I SAM-dependent methyltransferase [Legionella pneumophila subsp. fraseri]MDW8961579.1 class I SAM-dependent methyltransferase [Legionella pneumophila subsp. fraseri]HAT1798058.1 hypothetical protein [Legionella pneumophila]HAT1847421.1 hypothetical protein [Legionella pneumophila]HAT1862707.1 hypothetical protein [Legionella pneumophila]